MFEPRVAMASLSGEADARWATAGAPYAGAAFLGGIALCEPTRQAARALVARERTEFLPADPYAFIDRQLASLHDVDIRPGINVRATSGAAVAAAAAICARHDAILELNAHCRQAEMCAVGAGEPLLRETERLAGYVRAAQAAPAVSVKVRAELPGIDLVDTATALEAAGADAIHVDAMDSEDVIADIVGAVDLFVIANNGVRDRETVEEYLGYGADAVSVGRPSDRPAVLARVVAAVERYADGDASNAAVPRDGHAGERLPTAPSGTERRDGRRNDS